MALGTGMGRRWPLIVALLILFLVLDVLWLSISLQEEKGRERIAAARGNAGEETGGSLQKASQLQQQRKEEVQWEAVMQQGMAAEGKDHRQGESRQEWRQGGALSGVETAESSQGTQGKKSNGLQMQGGSLPTWRREAEEGWAKAEGRSRPRYYSTVADMPEGIEPEGHIVVLHQGRSGSTLLQRQVYSALLATHGVLMRGESLEEATLLPLLRKILLLMRQGDREGIRTLMEEDKPDVSLGGEDPEAVYAPDTVTHFTLLDRRTLEEYEALVLALTCAMRYPLAQPGSVTRYSLVSLKIFSICALGFPMDQYMEALHEAGARHLIVLHRSYLRRLVSSLAATATGIWHSNTLAARNANCDTPVVVDVNRQRRCDPNRLYTLPDFFRLSDHAFGEVFQGAGLRLFPSMLVLSYEMDIYGGSDLAAQKVLQYFGVSLDNDFLVLSVYSTTTDCPLDEIVANYEEVALLLSSSPWWHYLEPLGQQVAMADPISLVLDPPQQAK